MKKLISLKSDESGEVLYFTHQNGVDTIRKDDVIDLELLNPIKLLQTWSASYNIFILVTFFFYSAILYLSPSTGLQFTSYTFHILWNLSILLVVMVFFYLLSLHLCHWSTRNTRNKLKIYTVKGINEYKIKDEQIYSSLYDHFKIMLSKYLPKKGEMILYRTNPSVINFYKFSTFICPIVLSVIIIELIDNGNFLLGGLFLFLCFYFFISFVIGFRYGVIQYTFQGIYLDCKYSLSGKQKEMVSNEVVINDVKLIKNKNMIALIPKLYSGEIQMCLNKQNDFEEDLLSGIRRINKLEVREIEIEDESKYIKHYEGKLGRIFHQLQVAEDYRDITPIIFRYINDLSDEKAMPIAT
jgi:hypothetical protein